MSGCSDSCECCKCGGEMFTYSDYKPHDYIDGTCLNCGFGYYTIEEQKKLKEINQRRKDLGMKPIKKLRKQKWK